MLRVFSHAGRRFSLAARRTLVFVLAGVSGAVAPGAAGRLQVPVTSEKETRTPAQRKINSQLLYEIYRQGGDAERKGIPPGPTGVRIDTQGRALVDVRTDVTDAMQKTIRSLGGLIVSTSSEHHSIIARVPLRGLERLAEDPAVRFIEPFAEARTAQPATGDR